MKKIIFVSSGRCGTKKIYELFKSKGLNAKVKHQMPLSRFANIVGNIMFLFGESEKFKKKLYFFIISRYFDKKYFICSDPLSAMIIPESLVINNDTMIVHITRDNLEFANSIFKISRKRLKSFIAHNFIPFWQIGVYPLENFLDKNIVEKYLNINKTKNEYFYKNYSTNPNYTKVDIKDMFEKDVLSNIVNKFLGENISFSKKELSIKSNV